MAMTETKAISLIVQLLGHKPIITLDNADDLVISAQQAFDMLLPSVLSTGNWRFAMTIEQLSLSPFTPPAQSNWQNIYYLPSGWLKTIRVIPQNWDFEIFANNLIYSNWGTQSTILMEYAFQPELNQIPMHFWNYFIYEVACFLMLSNAQKPDYAAFLANERNRQWAIAAGTDAQNRPQSSQVSIPVLNNRFIGGIIGPQIG